MKETREENGTEKEKKIGTQRVKESSKNDKIKTKEKTEHEQKRNKPEKG